MAGAAALVGMTCCVQAAEAPAATKETKKMNETECRKTSKLLDRFMRYVGFDTQSSETSGTVPSTPGQLVLAREVADELKELGAADVFLSPGGIVYARLVASPGWEKVPVLGFLAHFDTAPEASGANVKPRLVTYTGEPIALGTSGLVLGADEFPHLKRCEGRHLVVTDGTTLLGADDKSGVAILVTAAAALLASDAPPHGEVRLAFTPDEEIGEGTRGFEPRRFGARLAFTVDGDDPACLETANFNAAGATFTIKGVSVHPGSAKGVMVNAVKVAAEILSLLPAGECPEMTEKREGFYHATALKGTSAAAELEFIVRDHDAKNFAARKQVLAEIAAKLNAKYGAGTVTLKVADQYRNMEEKIAAVPFLVEEAKAAIRAAGLEPTVVAIRGGTDGAQLSEMGIPCPNLGTGGHNFHGEREYAVVEEMEQALQIVLKLAQMRHEP